MDLLFSNRHRAPNSALLFAGAVSFVLMTSVAVPPPALAEEPLLHGFAAVAVSPDGSHIASIESDEAKVDGAKTHSSLVIRAVGGGAPVTVGLPCGDDVDCTPSSPAWAPDSKTLAFVLRAPKATTRSIERVAADGTDETTLVTFTGTLVDLRYSAAGRLAVLATAGAHKEVGATQAAAPMIGEIGSHPDEQRIATLDGSTLHFASPPNLYVYEYDWLPSGEGFAGTAAPGDGDNNWWIAKLYAFAHQTARVVYTPASPKMQLASPRVSPDGKTIAFIGGIMSDFGSTGGDVFAVSLAGGRATNLTAHAPSSVTAIAWSKRSARRLYCAYLFGATSGIEELVIDTALHAPAGSARQAAALQTVARQTVAPRSFSTGAAPFTVANDDTSAVVVQDFTHPPELAAGPPGAWRTITAVNAGVPPSVRARSVTWRSDGFSVTGWLLQPRTAGTTKRAMITIVHGGPSAAYRPQFVGRGTQRAFVQAGYDVFLPNPRGSFGAGEAFTQANVGDFGYGDLRDVLRGIDAVEQIAPVDDHRLGITGYSYGGYMTMWTVTQTKRFAAAVAGAGVSDWLSYYGQNGIDRWMIPFFGASVYDDPAIYARSSPITYIKRVTTPTFEYVGERDVECPMPQTQEFWHALTTFGVPTEFVVYAGEGHGLRDPKDRADAQARTLAWFARYFHASAKLQASR